MRRVSLFFFVFVTAALGAAQQGGPAARPLTPANAPAATGNPQLDSLLRHLEDASVQTTMDLGSLHIEKWKTNSGEKQEAKSTADSLARNLGSAMPELVGKVRGAGQAVGPAFQLYHDLDVVYDYLAGLSESAGVFGPKDDYQALSADVSTMQQLRRELADQVQQLATARDSEVANFMGQSRGLGTAGPKHIVIDDTARRKTRKITPKHRPVHKKTTQKPATTAPPKP